jgi:nucleotide-binding universal stress UspA family protein
MKTFSNILVPIDFEPHSMGAVDAATDIARCYAASVTIAHVYEPRGRALIGGQGRLSTDELNQVIADLQKRLEAARRQMEAAGVPSVKTMLLEGLAAPEIIHYAQKGDFDLIVVGTHGKSGIWHKLLGSVAEHVLREATCPVLTVRAKEDSKAA